MRKMIISMLLASVVATPVMAGPREDREAAREKRDSAREERRAKIPSPESTTATAPAREVRQQRVEERDQRRSAPAAAVVRTTDLSARESARQRVEQRREQVNQQRVDRGTTARQSQQQVIDRRQQATDRRVPARERAEQTKERLREIREARRNAPPPPISRTPRPGTQPPPPQTSRPTPPVNWNTSWRNDHRYDWHDYRRRYSWLFNLGFYYDPFGWNYYPYLIGYRMWPSYYSSSFWLNDPWQYRLPYAPPGTRWIRYYDDAILVDMWSGQVLDVIYDFFW